MCRSRPWRALDRPGNATIIVRDVKLEHEHTSLSAFFLGPRLFFIWRESVAWWISRKARPFFTPSLSTFFLCLICESRSRGGYPESHAISIAFRTVGMSAEGDMSAKAETKPWVASEPSFLIPCWLYPRLAAPNAKPHQSPVIERARLVAQEPQWRIFWAPGQFGDNGIKNPLRDFGMGYVIRGRSPCTCHKCLADTTFLDCIQNCRDNPWNRRGLINFPPEEEDRSTKVLFVPKYKGTQSEELGPLLLWSTPSEFWPPSPALSLGQSCLMTEYTTSSQAIRDYISSKERTKHWVRSRIEPPDQCYSPSAAPSIFYDTDAIPTAPPSEAGSTHSLPPKMVLRYPDGRPDEPIPYQDAHYSPKRGGSKMGPRESVRSQTMPMPNRARSGSHGAPRVPEEIRILPSPVDAPRSAASSHARSKSLPRNAYSQIQDPVPDLPLPHPYNNHHPGGAGLPGPLPLPRPGPLVTFSQPQPHPQPRQNHAPNSAASYGRHPPPIVYAPSHRSRTHYAPPAMFTHPPKMGPNGMIYSHSAPVPSQHRAKYPTPYPSAIASSAHMSSVNEERRSGSRTPNRRDRSRSGTARQLSPASSSSSLSDGSGSTYYVMPTGRQKVHVIHTPDATASVFTASSSTQSPTSPRSGSSLKKPFFQRLLGFAEKRLFSSSGDSSRGSSRGGRRLHRRHSTGGSGRSRSAPPGE
ncbi:hypothetical protein C8R44DRAFT_728055 [Mycena epipterygia]|nr:hypothetical protein C8R44DRAFT_728055 [Mycena epipterygia]